MIVSLNYPGEGGLDELGEAIAATAHETNRRTAVIASGDMSHRLTRSRRAVTTAKRTGSTKRSSLCCGKARSGRSAGSTPACGSSQRRTLRIRRRWPWLRPATGLTAMRC